MKIFYISAGSVLAIFALVILFFHIKTLKPVRSFLINALVGLGILFAVNLTAKYTGVGVGINIYSVSASAFFGVPAVIAMLIFNLVI